ncbi:hypothetical protein BgiBS90_015462, partial [Biomphalaria glabrata]
MCVVKLCAGRFSYPGVGLAEQTLSPALAGEQTSSLFWEMDIRWYTLRESTRPRYADMGLGR